MDSRPLIHDDSHARAILRGEMRKFEGKHKRMVDALKAAPRAQRSALSRFQSFRAHFKELFADYILHEFEEKKPGFARITWLSVYMDMEYSKQRADGRFPHVLYVSIFKMDSKKLNAGSKPMLAISTHAVIRVIRREQCRTMREVMDHLASLVRTLIPIVFARQVEEDFAFVSTDGYAICTFMEDGKLLIKTWMPARWWSGKQKFKLGALVKHLEAQPGKVWAKVTAEDFNTSDRIDPSYVIDSGNT